MASNEYVSVYAPTPCPACGKSVSLTGSGRKGENAYLTGTCPNGHPVYANHRIPS